MLKKRENRCLVGAAQILLLAASGLPLPAQLAAPNADGVSMGHLHFNVSDVEASLRFWKTLGGTPVKVGPFDVVKFPDVLVLVRKAESSGGTPDSVINHVGFRVRNLQESLTRWKAAGLETQPGASVRQAFVIGPGPVRIEMTEDTSMTAPIANHHIHFYTASVADTQAWYVKHFGARPGKRAQFEAADVPGVNLTFSAAPSPLAPTKGRALDHIGFEVRNLEAFCRKLEAAGVKFDVPYRDRPDLKIHLAFLTDPWGTYIELTEGLDRW